jgi:primosomal protein N'
MLPFNDPYSRSAPSASALISIMIISYTLEKSVEAAWKLPTFRRRLQGKYRWQIVVRAADPHALLTDMVFPLGWRVDINPVSLL